MELISFHMDALSSSVAFKINLDLHLTVITSSFYRLLRSKLGEGYRKAKPDPYSETSSMPAPLSS